MFRSSAACRGTVVGDGGRGADVVAGGEGPQHLPLRAQGVQAIVGTRGSGAAAATLTFDTGGRPTKLAMGQPCPGNVTAFVRLRNIGYTTVLQTIRWPPGFGSL
jgi:hypothetical protein